MGFIPISIDEYIKKHLKNNPNEGEKDLRKRLNLTLSNYQNRVKCACGNDLWIIGSAAVGNGCYTCITGESFPSGDYELDSAIKKRENKSGRRHIDDMDPMEIEGFFDDDGYEILPELIKKPSLCLMCVNDDNPNEEILCLLNRSDQEDEKEFKCYAFRKR